MFRFSILIFDFSLIILPFHLLGLKGLIGEIAIFLDSKFKIQCVALDQLKLSDTLPVIKNCDISICNDSSFSHLSAAIGTPTIVLMADTPLVYGNYSSQMYPIIPDGEETVTHDTLGKDKINPKKIFEKFQDVIN